MNPQPNPELLAELKAFVCKQYSFFGIEMKCIAKNFQLPDRMLDGVVFNIRGDYALCLSTGTHLDFYDINEWTLPLRSLSKITDSEAIEVAKIKNGLFNCAGVSAIVIRSNSTKLDSIRVVALDKGKYLTEEQINDVQLRFPEYQYLQQKSFALPIFYKGVQYSVERLVEYGIITLKS